jgi:hypothetical protein
MTKHHTLSEVFDYLSREDLFTGAQFVEPTRHVFESQGSYMLGQSGFVMDYSYRDTYSAAPNPSAAARGWCMEQFDLESAVEALRKEANHG